MNMVPMAQQSANIDLVTSIYAAFGRGDVAFILAQLDPSTEWSFESKDSPVPWHKPVKGSAGVAEFLSAFASNTVVERFEPMHFVVSGEDVICQVGLTFTIPRNGARVAEEQLHWWRIRNGKVTGLRHFEDTAQVIAAWRQ